MSKKFKKKGESFGEFEFFTKNERVFTVKSLTYSTAYVIYLADFLRILKDFPEDFVKNLLKLNCKPLKTHKEQYNLIKDKLTFSSEAHHLYQPCFSCHKNSHTLANCPMLNLVISRTLLISKYMNSFPQCRLSFKRKWTKFNARNIKSYTQKSQAIFMLDLDRNEDMKIESLDKLSGSQLDLKENSPIHNEENNELLKENSKESNEFLKETDCEIQSLSCLSPTLKTKSSLLKSKKSKKIMFLEKIEEINTKNLHFSQEIDNNSPQLLEIKEKEEKSLQDFEGNLSTNAIFQNPLFSREISLSKMKETVKKIENDTNFVNILGFESMHLFSKYQPNFNYNVIIMLLNKEFYYRMKRKKALLSKKKKCGKKKSTIVRGEKSLSPKSMKSRFSLHGPRTNPHSPRTGGGIKTSFKSIASSFKHHIKL